jgi:hypothetical protein
VSITPESAHDLARVFLADAYRMRLRRAGKTVEHPIAVGELLTDDRQPPTVVVAGLLHDVLEDTDVTPAELRTRFGPDIARLVEALTQDTAIVNYGERKAALRRQTPRCRPRSRDHVARRQGCEVAERGASTERPSDGALPGGAVAPKEPTPEGSRGCVLAAPAGTDRGPLQLDAIAQARSAGLARRKH